MPTRSEELTGWLSGTQWRDWTRCPLASDASSRRYERLAHGARTVILMDADPASCGAMGPFIDMAVLLRQNGLSAPEIYEVDQVSGFMILEDLGPIDFAQHLSSHPKEEPMLSRAVLDLLVRLDGIEPPEGLSVMTPDVGTKMLDPFFEFHAPLTSETDKTKIKAGMAALLSDLAGTATSLSLRDFHAQNLIWRPDESGLSKIGILDFQDAFIAPRGYDLMSYIKDVRRNVPPETAQSMIADFASHFDQDPDHLNAAVCCLSVQRNLRILGIFERLAQRDGKLSYLGLQENVLAHIRNDISHPSLTDLEGLVVSCLETGRGTSSNG